MARTKAFFLLLIAALTAMVLAIPQDHNHNHIHNHATPSAESNGFKPAQPHAEINATANTDAELSYEYHEGQESEISSEGAESIPHGHSISVSRPHEFSHFSKRGAGGMYECAGKYWRGPCKWTRVDDFKCRTRSYTRDSSMGPDQGLYCVIYNNWNCAGNGVRFFTYPGVPDYQANGWLQSHGFNTGPLSYKCSSTVSLG